jgi:hypothetical protein
MPRKKKEQSFKVVPAGKRDVMQLDIILFVDMKEIKAYIDPEIQIVLKDIIQQYGTVAVKINWFSPDIQIFVDRSLEQKADDLIQSVTEQMQSTAVESQIEE